MARDTTPLTTAMATAGSFGSALRIRQPRTPTTRGVGHLPGLCLGDAELRPVSSGSPGARVIRLQYRRRDAGPPGAEGAGFDRDRIDDDALARRATLHSNLAPARRASYSNGEHHAGHRFRGIGGAQFVFTKRLDRFSVGELWADDFDLEFGVMNYGLEIDDIHGVSFLIRAGAMVDLARTEVRPAP